MRSTPGPALTITGAQLTAAFGSALEGTALTDALEDAGYTQSDSAGGSLTTGAWPTDGYWTTSGHAVPLSGANFFLPGEVVDPTGATTTLTYDAETRLAASALDPAGDTVSVTYDYRVLQPATMTDKSDNVSAVSFDALGRVERMALRGKPPLGSSAYPGDTVLGAATDATMYFTYTDFTPAGTGTPMQPACVKRSARTVHQSSSTTWIHHLTYVDGFGRTVLEKASAANGPSPERDENGVLTGELGASGPRWTGTGRVVYDRKGNPVRQYEPYFSATPNTAWPFGYEDEAELRAVGVSPVLTCDPLGRVTRVDFPDGSYGKVDFTPWEERHFDQNDTTAGRFDVDTPKTAHLDSLGRGVVTEEILVHPDTPMARETLATVVELDLVGRPLTVTDPRGVVVADYRVLVDEDPDVFVSTYDFLGRPLRNTSPDAGVRFMLDDALGRPFWRMDARGTVTTFAYDTAGRPTGTFTTPSGGSTARTDVLEYSPANLLEAHQGQNLRGIAIVHKDTAGVTEVLARDFAGRVTSSSRKLLEGAQAPTTPPDPPPGPSPDVHWDAIPEPPALDAVMYETTTEFDALGRPTSLTRIRDTALEVTETYTYNEGGALVGVAVALDGDTAAVPVLASIRYDAKGRRESISRSIEGSTDVMRTDYSYDPVTARLTRIKTGRASASVGGTLSGLVQDLEYAYDPAGNIVGIDDHSRAVVVRDNLEVGAHRAFTYDSLYRLVEATGREHDSFSGSGSGTAEWESQPADQNDLVAIHRYTETYSYDASGNITEIAHANHGVPGGWTRTSLYESTSNRLRRTWTGNDPPTFDNVEHDSNGNMTRPPESALADTWVWSTRGELAHVDLGGGGKLYATYDAGNQRLRKRRIHNNGLVETTVTLGGIDYYDRSVATAAGDVISRRTIHVMDGERRIALIETTRVVGAGGTGVATSTVTRHQVDDHLGSACVELDEQGVEISREEFAPYGTTTYREKSTDISQKRYRYTGMERDDETGLSYHSARYYVPWLGRWTAADPIALKGGMNLYQYCRCSPACLSDASGLAPPARHPSRFSEIIYYLPPRTKNSETAAGITPDGMEQPSEPESSPDGHAPPPEQQSKVPPKEFPIRTEAEYRAHRANEMAAGRRLGNIPDTPRFEARMLADKYGMLGAASSVVFPLGARLLRHWYEGTGDAVLLDSDTVDRTFAPWLHREVNDILAAKLSAGVTGRFYSDPAPKYFSRGDAQVSFAGATFWVNGEITYDSGRATVTYQIFVYDEYDFDPEFKETPLGDLDRDLARVEELGLAKGFRVMGASRSITATFEMKEGKWTRQLPTPIPDLPRPIGVYPLPRGFY